MSLQNSATVSSQAWKTLERALHPSSSSFEFWWRTTGFILATLLEEAGYDIHSQYSILLFHFQHIAARLGPRPSGLCSSIWQSFMTDDFSPVEYSWSWESNEAPKIRYSIEAIGPQAGTERDPFNQISTLELVNELRVAKPDINWDLFEKIRIAFDQSADSQIAADDLSSARGHRSSMFLGFDLGADYTMAKAYLTPIEALHLQQSPLEIVSHTLKGLGKDHLRFFAYKEMLDFIEADGQGQQLKFLGLAVDCVDPGKSRLKLYVRFPRTSFESVCSILTMGGKLDNLWTQRLLIDLEELWRLVLGLEAAFNVHEELRRTHHPTAGILYNFDIQNGSLLPATKVYIPVRHYGENDLRIAEGLIAFLDSRGVSRHAKNYMQMLRRICTYRRLEDGCGIQTYISCAVKDGMLSLTSYLGPEVYHRARLLKQC